MLAAISRILGVSCIALLPVLLLVTNYPAVQCPGWQYDDSEATRLVLIADPQMEGDARVRRQGWWGELNNRLNDIYFAHISRTIDSWYSPVARVIFLGDIFSFQYLSDEEFSLRKKRFNHSFHFPSLKRKNRKMIAGNHDIGYGAELTSTDVRRWERMMGKRMWSEVLDGVRLVASDGLALDGAAATLTSQEWDFLMGFANDSAPSFLFLHIPLWKPDGACVDSPEMRQTGNKMVVMQTMISFNSTSRILHDLRPAAIFTGHDHEGCQHVHPDGTPEFTLRSVMGDYGGGVTLLEYRLDPTAPRGVAFTARPCPFIPMKALLGLLGAFCATFLLFLPLAITPGSVPLLLAASVGVAYLAAHILPLLPPHVGMPL